MQDLFNQTQGTDPIFALVDGANRPDADISTLDKRQAAFSMLLNRGVIRIGLPMPDNAEFDLAAVDDPYGFASAKELSMFRRPLPTTNVKFLASVMWDGRETALQQDTDRCTVVAGNKQCFAPRDNDLMHQANSAIHAHAQATADMSKADREAILDFERGLYTAQVVDNAAGDLRDHGALGGPVEIFRARAYFGINDLLQGDFETRLPFNNVVMSLFDKWANARTDATLTPAVAAARESIARGQVLFNTKPINITGVAGLNDELRMPVIRGSCTSCHDTPRSGTHSTPLFLNVGVMDASRRPGLGDSRGAMPLYTFRNKVDGTTVQTMDPGYALITGKWKDIGKVKVPSLRAIETRSPYFQDGSESELTDVVRFYDKRFSIGLTDQEVQDLAAFLRVM
ncbi:MAG: cytochrome C [Burkholderiales bacterium]|nr:cytochrome C [Burkholderiales bacterium]